MTVDPLEAQTQQPYEYAGDDLVDFTDPSGLIFGIPRRTLTLRQAYTAMYYFVDACWQRGGQL